METDVPPSADPWANPFFVAARDTTRPFGIVFRLSDVDGDPMREPEYPTVARSLPPEAASSILTRLLGPAPDAPAPPAFRFPPRSMAAPRPGTTTRGSFTGGPAAVPGTGPISPLRVLSTTPRGTVAAVSQVTASFSQPMVPLSSIDDPPPGVRLSPVQRGMWRWLDPFTLVFDAAGGLPGATRYEVEIPAGITSVAGESLRESTRWTFVTPALALRQVLSTEAPQLDQPVLLLVFDQRVDPTEVVQYLRLEVDSIAVPIRLATTEERSDPRVASRVVAGEPDHIVSVRPAAPIPRGGGEPERNALLRVAAGAPSLEGPERSTVEAVHEFRLRNRLSVAEHGCGRADTCPAGAPWTIRFNHPLQWRPSDDAGSWVRIDPALRGATVEVWNTHLVVLGAAEPGTTYSVQLAPSITSWSGDRLGAASPLDFAVGPAEPTIWLPGGVLATISAAEPARYLILSRGVDSLRVTVRAVAPGEWLHSMWRLQLGLLGMLGRDTSGTVLRTTLPVTRTNRGLGESTIDLGPALDAAGGHVILSAAPATPSPADSTARSRWKRIWVQREGPVLDVAEDGEALTVRASSHEHGAAVPAVRLALYTQRAVADRTLTQVAEATTDAAGLATLTADIATRGPQWVLAATHAGTTTFLPSDLYTGRFDRWGAVLRAHFVLDRPIHAPGDTVRFAGWLRRAHGVGREPVAIGAGDTVVCSALDPRGGTIAEDTLRAGPNGRIESSFVLPISANTGMGQVRVRTGGLETRLRFAIEEVRRPNFEVALRVEPGPYTPGDRIIADVTAQYFTGGGMPAADVDWQVQTGPARFVPPGRRGWAFGSVRYRGGRAPEPAEHESKTDASGRHRLAIDIDDVHPATAMRLSMVATVTDLDDQSRSATGTVLVHPSGVYVGLRTPARFIRAGEPLDVDAIVVDLEGRAVSGRPIALRVMRQGLRIDRGQPVVDESLRGQCDRPSRAEPVRCRFTGLPAGDYVIEAIATDTAGRPNRSEIAVRVAGEISPAGARAAVDSVSIVPDRAEYAPGDTARLLIETSYAAAEGLLTIRRGGVLETLPLKVERHAGVVRFPVRDEHVPNVELHVALFTVDGRSATANTGIRVAPDTRALAVEVAPDRPEVEPGARTYVVVTVNDTAGRPVPGADVVLSAVDEALLALRSGSYTDPLADIYPASSAEVTDHDLRAHRAPLDMLAGPRTAGGGTIEGVVLDGLTGAPIGGAWVELDSSSLGTWSGRDGSYRIDGVAAGTHSVKAGTPGWVTRDIADVMVRAGRVTRAHFTLLTRWAMLSAGRQTVEVRAGMPRLPGPEPVPLNAVVVSARRVSDADMELPPDVTVPPPQAPGQAAARARTNFSPVAAFVARARTGLDGRVRLDIDVPDNLTRYRIRAVAAAGDRRFGAGEAVLVAKRPIMARPVPPRFLNQGDRFDLRVLLENRSGSAREIDVAVRATNAGLEVPEGRRVLVPAGDRTELRFAAVAVAPGSARFQIAVTTVDSASGRTVAAADAADIAVPVLTPIATEAFAVYGQLDDARPVAFPVLLPAATLPGRDRIELGFSTTAAHGLRDALAFLIDCFYDLPEVAASRTIALSSLSGVPAGALPWPRSAIEAAIRSDVARLARFQLRDGGWGVWAARFDADPFITVHAANALQRARAFGVPVPARTLDDAIAWLRRLDDYAAPDSARRRYGPDPLPRDYPHPARLAVQAYALHVRARLGDDVAASAAAVLHDAGTTALPADALAWLLPVLSADSAYERDAAEVRRELDGRVVLSGGTAGIVSPWHAGERAAYASPRRTDALVLAALVSDGHASPERQASLARGLMAHRIRGRWSNSLENAFAVAALADYLSGAEAVEPALVARAWVGRRLAGERAFEGRLDERHELTIPADSVGKPGDRIDLVVAREGSGRLYYRAAFEYALAGTVPAVARGFEVERTYEAVDHADDVRRDADGTWRIRLGARVRVRLAVAAAGPRYHVAVVDHLPAGLEAANRALAGTAGLFAPSQLQFPRNQALDRFPIEHVNVRADRYEVYASRLEAGRREVTYLALATTPGDFTAPAARAEEMYAPETFGRGASGRVIIEAPPGASAPGR